MDERKERGDRGEAAVADALERRGCAILERQYRCRWGEIDLIVRTGDGILCFVEVKLRKSAAYGSAAAFVDRRKQEKLCTTAMLYLSLHPTALQPRFDVIEIYAPQGEKTAEPEIIHLENAF